MFRSQFIIVDSIKTPLYWNNEIERKLNPFILYKKTAHLEETRMHIGIVH